MDRVRAEPRAVPALVDPAGCGRARRSSSASASPGSGRRSCCGGTAPDYRSVRPSRSSTATRRSTSSRSRGPLPPGLAVLRPRRGDRHRRRSRTSLWGGIRPQAPAFADKVTPAVRAHLSVLLGLIMLVKAWGYYLGRFDLLTSPRGVVEGASYTDVKAQLPALNFLTIVAVICAVLFFVNIRVRQWSLPVIAVGAARRSCRSCSGPPIRRSSSSSSVKPKEQQRESLYIGYNIEGDATSVRLGHDRGVRTPRRSVRLGGRSSQENDATVSNIRLWRPSVSAGELPVAAADPPVLRVPRRGRGSLQRDRREPRVLMVSRRGDAARTGSRPTGRPGRPRTSSTRTGTVPSRRR